MSFKFTKQSFTLVFVLAAVVLVLAYKYFGSAAKPPSLSQEFSKIKGGRQAPVQITEFIDFQCPACAYGALYLKKFMDKHPDIVRLEMKYFPLSSHKHAFVAAQYSECAARQKKFWPFHDILLERQSQWKVLSDAQAAFEKI